MNTKFINTIRQCLLLLLVFQTLNLSINSIEFCSSPLNDISENDKIDYIDSTIEFLVENVLGFPKHTFDDRLYNADIARMEQGITHFDLKNFKIVNLLSDLTELNLQSTNIIHSNENIITLCLLEAPFKPPREMFV